PAVQRRNSAIGDVWGPRGHRSDFPIADRCFLGYLDDLISFGASSRFLKSAGLGGTRGDGDKQGPDRSSRSGAVAACDRRRGRQWIQPGPFEENLLGSGGGVRQAQAEQPGVDQSQSVGGLDSRLRPGGSVRAHSYAAAQAFERAHQSLRIRTLEGYIDSEFS